MGGNLIIKERKNLIFYSKGVEVIIY